MKRKKTARSKPLTMEQQFAALWLNRQAEVLLGIPPNSDLPPKEPLPKLRMDDPDRRQLANYLRRITGNHAALKAITNIPKQPARRGRRVQSARNHKIALEYLVTYHKHGNSLAATTDMRDHWKIGRSQIMAIYETCQTARSWVKWAQYVIRRAKVNGETLEETIRKIRQSG